ncbi:MAG: hypothetical protein IBX70_05430 [Clostridia bacterium]|nr:hypothetical protein [Clostridia bacterium]
MDRKNRPKGREKRVGSGSVKVEKRGSGLGRQSSGPVGGIGGLGSDSPLVDLGSSLGTNNQGSPPVGK